MATSALPSLSGLSTHGGLNREELQLFHHVKAWLDRNRPVLNEGIKLENPVSGLDGIECEVLNVYTLDRNLMGFFKMYNPRCGDIEARFDDAIAKNVYFVFIPFHAQARGYVGGGEGGMFWPAFFDEPKKLVTVAGLIGLAAAFTTTSTPWLNLVVWVRGLVG